MPNFKPVKQPRISDVVFQQLKNAILANDFKAGDRLSSEKDLSEKLKQITVSAGFDQNSNSHLDGHEIEVKLMTRMAFHY